MPPIMFFSNFPISYARWASTPIMYQQCNCDNGNNKWLNWWMMSEMVKNIGQMFRKPEKQPPIPYAYNPYQQYVNPYQTMYPYVNLNNTQQYPLAEQDEGLRDLQEAYKNCKTKFSFVKVNDKYIAIDKDGKRIKADTAEELMDLIDAKVDGGGGLKPEEEVPPAEEVPPIDEGNDPPTDPSGNEGNLAYSGSYKKEHWNGHFQNFDKFKKLYGADLSASGILKKYLDAHFEYNAESDEYKNLEKDFIKRNPSLFENDGKAKYTKETLTEDILKKLDLPLNHYIVSDYKLTRKNNSTSNNANGNNKFDFKNDPKHYTAENIAEALQEYDNTIGGEAPKYINYPFYSKKTEETEKVKDILKDSIKVTIKGNDLIVEVDYKGNGPQKLWHWKMTYKDCAKNGVNKPMSEIYKDIIEGYNRWW